MCATARKAPGSDGDALNDHLRASLAAGTASALCVALSGGPDSTVLLHLLAQLPEARARRLRALHVDHGLHPDSARWADHCRAFCEKLDVPLTTARVEVIDNHGEGVEAAARRARRSAFRENIRDGEWLALAHHRDDQIETVLLKLLRGAGPEGLAGMRSLRAFGHGWLWRPLLEIPRETLRNYLIEHDLAVVDDPSNRDQRFARNTLRREVLPLLAQHWPHAGASILHSAALCRAAADHLHDEAVEAIAGLRRDHDTLDVSGWLSLSEALRAPVLDHWLHGRGLAAPTDAQRRELERQAAFAAADAVPCVAWVNAEVHIWDGRLHAMPPLAPVPVEWSRDWNDTTLELPPDCGALMLETSDGNPPPPGAANFAQLLQVRLRRGGERIRPAGDRHTRELRDLFQRERTPPWLRARCPLVFASNELIAVADLWISASGTSLFGTRNLRPHWSRPEWTE